MTKIGIHIFRKDLRIYDNLALNELASEVDEIIGLFIYDQKQIKKHSTNLNYHSNRSAQFLIDCVNDLNKQCSNKLVIAYGECSKIIESMIKKVNPIAISFNADFTPYAIKRDNMIKSLTEKYDIKIIINESDQCHVSMDQLVKKDKTPYMVFGSFCKNLKMKAIPKPKTNKITFRSVNTKFEKLNLSQIAIALNGGRSAAIEKIKRKIKISDNDHLSNESTRLSPYLNFGCLSIREVYSYFKDIYGEKSKMLESIAWRDFYLCIYRFANRGNQYNHIDDRYDRLKWPKLKESEWRRFIKCDTGFLLIDAIMTELLQTGYINNRARLLLSTFWIKYLLIDPFDLEYGSQSGFSRLLIDCSASQNKLNHQWVIGDLDFAGRRFGMKGTHSLSGRIIRIDNEMIKRYDPEFEYIKKWLPVFQGKSIKECKTMIKNITPMYEWKEQYMKFATLFQKI